MENTKPVKSRIPSKNHIQYDSLRYVSNVAAGPTLHIAFVVNKEQGYQLILRGGRYKGDGLQRETTGTNTKQETCHLNKSHVHHVSRSN